MSKDQRAGAAAKRNLLALIVAIALSCALAGCGTAATSAGSATAVSTTTVFPSRLTAAGYQALRADLELEEKTDHDHTVALARIKHLQSLCGHLGPDVVDLEVQGVRSACTGSMREARAILELRACKELVVSARRQCVVNSFTLFASGSDQVVGAENGMLQILGKGPCYKLLRIGVPQDQRLLVVTNTVVEALNSYSLTRKLLNKWQRALDVDIRTGPSAAVDVRRSTSCRPV